MRLRTLTAILIGALLGLTAAVSTAADTRYYDDHGRYQGRVDSSGRHYDEHGRYQGRQDANGRYYD